MNKGRKSAKQLHQVGFIIPIYWVKKLSLLGTKQITSPYREKIYRNQIQIKSFLVSRLMYFLLGTYESCTESSGKPEKGCLCGSERQRRSTQRGLTLQLALKDARILITKDGGEGMRRGISCQGNTMRKSETYMDCLQNLYGNRQADRLGQNRLEKRILFNQ